MQGMGMKDTKLDIFNAAVDMFAEHNYHSVTMRDIADRVGIKASSIYNHFSAKDELLQQIFEYYEQGISDGLPDLDDLLRRAQYEHPVKLLLGCQIGVAKEAQTTMEKILLIIAAEMRHDITAEGLIRRTLVQLPEQYVTALLHRLMELDRIEPLDVEQFAQLYSNFYYAVNLRKHSGLALDPTTVFKGLESLCGLIHTRDREANMAPL